MSLQKTPSVLSLCALLCACTDGSPAGSLQITVSGLGADVTQLRTVSTIDGVRVAGGERLCPLDGACDVDDDRPAGRYLRDGDRARFALVPPTPRGALALGVEALRADRCFVAAGSGVIPAEAGALEVNLQPLPAPRCCNEAWVCRENPLPDNHGLNAIWGTGPEDLWAVGDLGTIARGQGGAFTRAPSPTRANLVGVWGRSAQDVWIVGHEGSDGAGVLLHDAGAGFVVHRTFPVQTTSIRGWADEFWVGGQGVVFRFTPAGAPIETIDLSGTAITALGGPGPGQAWLAGYESGGAAVLRRTGTTLSRVSPNMRFTPRALHATATEVWVLGDDNGELRLAHRATDGTWSETRPQRVGVQQALLRSEDTLGIWGSDAGDLWIASGEIYHLPDRSKPPLAWPPEVLGRDPFARALWGDPDGVWAAGSGGQVLRHSGAGWARRHPAPEAVLDTFVSVSGSLRGPPWLASRGGLYRGDAQQGLAPVPRQRGHLYTKVAAVGADAIVVRDLRDLLRVQPDGGESLLLSGGEVYDVWARGEDLWAVGEGVVHVRGGGACAPPSGVGCQSYRGIWGRESGELFVVGPARMGKIGCVLRCDEAGRWTDETPVLPDADLYDVWGEGDEVFAVGNSGGGGLILRRAGGVWQQEATALRGRLPPLIGVFVPPAAAGAAWALGNFGELWRRGQGGWGEIPLPRHLSLGDHRNYAVDIFGLRDDDVWFIGTHGSIFRYRP